MKKLIRLYNKILKRLIGPNAGGVIQRSARGLMPVANAVAAPGGATLGSLAHVVALDLAYLIADVCGTGSLSGLLIHDSPECIVMESARYDRLLRFVVDMEQAGDGSSAAFQYIVTPTTPPPEEIAGLPFSVLTLDARNDATRLLKASF